MTIYAPVREARRLFEQRYAEQLPLYVDDLTQPRLLSEPGNPTTHPLCPSPAPRLAEQTAPHPAPRRAA